MTAPRKGIGEAGSVAQRQCELGRSQPLQKGRRDGSGGGGASIGRASIGAKRAAVER